MQYYNGNTNDSTDYESNHYLQINSCGVQEKKYDYTIFRNKGRKDYLILLITDGECEVLFDGKDHLLHKGDVAVYKPYEKQRYFLKEDCSALWLHFNGYAIKEIFENYGLQSGIYYFHGKDTMIQDSMVSCMDKFNHPWKKRYANSELLNILEKISISSQPLISNTAAAESIEKILSYINSNYAKDLTLEDLAKKSGYSKSRFSHIFSEVIGTTPIKYQNDIRLKNALELITSTNMPISDISFACGFKDPLYFSRIFKKKYEISPNQKRAEARSHFIRSQNPEQ